MSFSDNDNINELNIDEAEEIIDKAEAIDEVTEDDGIMPDDEVITEEADNAVEMVENPEAVIEAVLFSVGNSVEYKKLSSLIGRNIGDTKKIVLGLKEQYDNDDKRGITIVELDESVQMCSKEKMYEHLIKIAKTPKQYNLTDTLLETLSIIAYKQPVTRLEIEKIRGVSCDHAVNKLLEYGLIMELGRLDAPGRPLLFGTTEEFLRSFGVTSIDELPSVSPERVEEFKKEAEEEINVNINV